MARSAVTYACQQCGASFYKWAGKCDDCGAWNTLVEERKEVPEPIDFGHSPHGVEVRGLRPAARRSSFHRPLRAKAPIQGKWAPTARILVENLPIV